MKKAPARTLDPGEGTARDDERTRALMTRVADGEFNLRSLVREVSGTSLSADPESVAAAVFDHIKVKDRPDALRQALRTVVREVITQNRGRASQETHESQSSTAGSARSSKVAGIRDWWKRSLRTRLHVGEGEWRFLADCTRDELLFAASERREHAERNLARAEQYEQLAKLLADRGVEHVRDLPDDDLGDTLGGVAA